MSAENTGGVGFLGLLAIAFIVLKLTGVIAWSWWWVLAPVWIPALIAFVIGACAALALWGGLRGLRAHAKRHAPKDLSRN